MILKVKLWLCIFAVFLFPYICSSVSKKTTNFNRVLETFGARLHSKLAHSNGNKNIVFSPLSLHTCLSMVLMGAEGQTAAQMKKGLALPKQQNLKELANYYHNRLNQYQDSDVLTIVNKIYVQQGHEVQKNFSNLVTKKFFSSVDSIDFSKAKKAAETINSWVEGVTNEKITDLIDSNSLQKNTGLVLINAIYLNAEWAKKFPERSTRQKDFYLSDGSKFKVQMMHVEGKFKYGKLPELDAAALEMRYKSGLSMLIILPNSGTGLADLEEKLKTISLSNSIKNMKVHDVIVDLPKFNVEVKIDLKEVLESMGMDRMFSEAEFGKMLKGRSDLIVSNVVQKAVIEVNERGTEAAAATATQMNMLISPQTASTPETFNVDRPFYYAVRNKNGVPLFAGSIKAKF